MGNIDIIIIDALRSITECAGQIDGNIITHELTKTVEPSKTYWGTTKKNERAILRTKLVVEITQQI
jgi:hypothetical protein